MVNKIRQELDTNFIYAPNHGEVEFRCSKPISGAKEFILKNGKFSGTSLPYSLVVEKGEKLKDILQLVFLRTNDSPSEISYQSNYIFNENSEGEIILCSHTASSNKFITNEQVNIEVKDGANLKIVLLQNEHNGAEHNARFNINIGRDASLSLVFLLLHGGKINNTINASLNAPGAKCDLSGLYLVDGIQEVSTDIIINHNHSHTNSSQLFKGILDDSSSAHFAGTINVKPNAQKVEALQANHNLIISPKAKAYIEPQLQIYADDVKCSHGATIGRLDENELFYLRSRGISMQEAKLLQEIAFSHSVLENISNSELQSRISNLTEQRLRGEFSKCQDCCLNCC